MSISKKYFNIAAWITLLLGYILPYELTEEAVMLIGFPFSYLTVYIQGLGSASSLLRTMHLNPVLLLIDISIIYVIIHLLLLLIKKRQ